MMPRIVKNLWLIPALPMLAPWATISRHSVAEPPRSVEQ